MILPMVAWLFFCAAAFYWAWQWNCYLGRTGSHDQGLPFLAYLFLVGTPTLIMGCLTFGETQNGRSPMLEWLMEGSNSAVASIVMFGLAFCILIPTLGRRRGDHYYDYKYKKKELKLRAKRYGCIRRAAALAGFAAAIAAAAFGTVRLLRYLFKGDTDKAQQ